MSEEKEQCMEEDENNLITTPERQTFSPILHEGNDEMCSASQSNDIDKLQQANQENLETLVIINAAQSTPNEQSENIGEPLVATCAGIESTLGTNGAVAEEESFREEVDYGMPIAKTPRHVSDSRNHHFSDLESDVLLGTGTTVTVKREKDSDNNMPLHENSATSALDAYLDGIETPIAPIRVKAEFTVPKTPQREPFGETEYDSTNVMPPPPPVFSSNSNLDFVSDGIATPRLSLAAINRIRVKSEFTLPPSTPKHTNEDSYEASHFVAAEVREDGEVSPGISDEASSDNEPIPEDFFDDLLHDKLKERIEAAQNIDLEEKYSDRLREWERLKNERKKAKKLKKSKKKSRKRSLSRSESPTRKTSDMSTHDKSKRSRYSPPNTEMPSSSNSVYVDTTEENLTADTGIQIKTEFSANDSRNIEKEPSPPIENIEEIEELTPQQRKERAIRRATALLKHFKRNSNEDSKIFSTFLFVSTVRKLPTSHSYVQQQIYENRSPLHTVNNVSYKFNSHITRFNMEEWGLAALPSHAAKLAKLVGCDAQYIHNKLKTIKIPAKLKKIKQEPNREAVESEEEEELIETNSSLHSNAMTQTDDMDELGMLGKVKGYEIGVQVEPSMYSIGSQTLETQSPTDNLHKDDEAPIMKIIRDLNENQLMAIHAFAELIKEPNANTNAMEMYKIQMQILDIYKMSQIPSALLTSQNPIVNNYTTMTARHIEQPDISIQSVQGADGKQFSVNDPRAKSAAYAKRVVNDNGSRSSSNYDNRHSPYSHSSNARCSSNEGYPHSSYNSGRSSGNIGRPTSTNSSNIPPTHQRQYTAQSNQPPPHTATKHYGRGSLRR